MLLTSQRLEKSNSALDSAEKEWWEKYSEVEDRFCWVQTHNLRMFLRHRYINRIIDATKGKRVLELGCGTGWLSILMAQKGASYVVGLDFSKAQLDRATKNAQQSDVGEKVNFIKTDGSLISELENSFHTVVCHGILHHLSKQEIKIALESAYKYLKPGGLLLLIEPIIYPNAAPSRLTSSAIKCFEFLIDACAKNLRWRKRYMCDQEQHVRQVIASRNHGIPPFGPSPKELPFLPTELENLAEGLFYKKMNKKCLVISHSLATEVLLINLSQPKRSLMLGTIILPITWLIDTVLIYSDPDPRFWYFEFYEFCKNN